MIIFRLLVLNFSRPDWWGGGLCLTKIVIDLELDKIMLSTSIIPKIILSSTDNRFTENCYQSIKNLPTPKQMNVLVILLFNIYGTSDHFHIYLSLYVWDGAGFK